MNSDKDIRLEDLLDFDESTIKKLDSIQQPADPRITLFDWQDVKLSKPVDFTINLSNEASKLINALTPTPQSIREIPLPQENIRRALVTLFWNNYAAFQNGMVIVRPKNWKLQ